MTPRPDDRSPDRPDVLDLRALAPDDATRDRVVAEALARLDAADKTPDTGVLEAAGRYVWPSLLAAAAVAALLLWSGDDEPSPTPAPSAGPPGSWAAWVRAQRAPAPEELIVQFAGGSVR